MVMTNYNKQGLGEMTQLVMQNVDYRPMTPEEPKTARAPHTRPNRQKVLTPRDNKVLTWVGEMYTVRFDLLAKLLGDDVGQSSKPQAKQGEITASRVYRLVAKWRDMGLVEYAQKVGGEPNYVWLTSKGLKEMGLTDYSYQPPSLSLIKHYHAVTLVRRYLEQKNKGMTWVSERYLRGQVSSFKAEDRKGQHIVDGIMTFEGEDYAIEVELSQKSQSRSGLIAFELVKSYKNIAYYTEDRLIPQVQEATKSYKDKITIKRLSEVTQVVGVML